MQTFSVLKNRDTLKLWVSQILSSIGDNFYDMAVIWIATSKVGAGAGLVVLAGSLSTLIFGIFGGIFADRWDRRITMATVDFIRMTVLLGLVAISLTDDLQLWHLALVSAINMGLNALFQSSLIASLKTVSRDTAELQATNALMDVTARIARALAPSLAGFLLATTLPAYLFFADAMTFLFSALAVLSLSRSHQWRAEAINSEQRKTILSDVMVGFRAIHQHDVMRWLMPIKAVLNAVWGVAFVIGIPLMVDDRFGGDARIYGFIVASYGVGNVIGNLIIGNMQIRRRALVLFGGMVVFGIGFIIMATAQHPLVAMFGAFFASFGGPMDDIMMLLYIQQDFEPNQIGKVYSVRLVLSELGFSVGVASAPIIFGLVSISTGIAIAGVASLICGLAGWMRFGLTVYKPKLQAS